MGLFGSSSGKKATRWYKQAMDEAQKQYEYNKGLSEQLWKDYGEQLSPIMRIMTGGQIDGNTPYGQSYQNLQRILGVLDGTETTPQQQKYDNLSEDYINQLTGANKSAERQTADDWNSKYLSLLANSPDTAFNAGVTELARGVQAQNDNIRKTMQGRGISSSGINVAKLGSTPADQAKSMSQLQGQRIDRQLNNAGIASQFAQNLADKQQQNYGLATQLAGTNAQQKQQNLMQASDASNAYAQQNLSNILSILGAKNGLIDKSAGNNYYNSINNVAGSYANRSAGESNAFGGLLGGALSYISGLPAVGSLFGLNKSSASNPVQAVQTPDYISPYENLKNLNLAFKTF